MNYDETIVANFTSDQVKGLKKLVAGVLSFGVVTSVAANVVHAVTTAAPGKPGWQVAGSAVWAALAPIVLFLGIELVSRIPVTGKLLSRLRLGATVAIAAMSGWVSYWSIVAVAQFFGEHDWGKQYMYPGLIDGVMAVATISLIELGRIKRMVATHEAKEAAIAAAAQLAAKQAAAAAAAVAQKAADDAAAAAAAKAAAVANKLILTPEEAAQQKRERKRDNYDAKNPGDKSTWTFAFNGRIRDQRARAERARDRAAATAPTSPGQPPVALHTVQELEDAVR